MENKSQNGRIILKVQQQVKDKTPFHNPPQCHLKQMPHLFVLLHCTSVCPTLFQFTVTSKKSQQVSKNAMASNGQQSRAQRHKVLTAFTPDGNTKHIHH